MTSEEYERISLLSPEAYQELTCEWTGEQWGDYWSKYYDRCVVYDGGEFQILWDGVHLIRYWRNETISNVKEGRFYQVQERRVEVVFYEPHNSWEACLKVLAWRKYNEQTSSGLVVSSIKGE